MMNSPMTEKYTVTIPTSLNLQNTITFCKDLFKLPEYSTINFDFKWMKHVEPFGLAYTSSIIKQFAVSRPNTKFTAENFQKHHYPAHMGFFQAFGLDFGKNPGQATGSSTYIPLTIMEVDDIKNRALQRNISIGDEIENEANKLAKVLVQTRDEKLIEALTYSFREIMRNVVEHSNSQVIEFCAQYWPTKNKVELVVLDLGIGVNKALSNNPYLTLANDRDALQLALMPGISGKMYKGIRKETYNPWQNSGFGLYMTNRLARMGGSFFIASGQSGVLLEQGSKKDLDVHFNGTALRMVVNTGLLGDLGQHLERFKREGYLIANSLKNIGQLEASTASMMLSKDFYFDNS